MVLDGWLVSVVLASDTDGWFAILTGVDDGFFAPNYVPSSRLLWVQVLVFSAFALAMTWAVHHGRLGRIARTVMAAVLSTLLVVSLALLAQSGPARRLQLIDSAGPRVCSNAAEARAAVCVWPDDVSAQGLAAQTAAAMWQPLRHAGVQAPGGVVDEGLNAPPGWASVRLWYPDPSTINASIASATLSTYWCSPEDDLVSSTTLEVAAREAWLLHQVQKVESGYYGDELVRVLTLSPNDQVEWLLQRPPGVVCASR